MTDHLKVAAVGDLQLPWTDYRALTLWFDVMKWWKPNNVVFTGDIDDQLEYSRFSDGTTDEFFNVLSANAKANAKLEAKAEDGLFIPPHPVDPLPFFKDHASRAAEFYADVRKANKRAELFSCLGNHDIRVFGYVDKKSPEYKDQITPNFLYNFDKLGIDYMMYLDKPRELFPGVYFHHGATTSQSGAAVRVDIENYGVSLVRGHDHQGAVVYKTFPLTQTVLFGLACGHLSDTDAYGMQYANNPTWQMGFGILHIFGEEVHPQFIHIKPDYTCVVDGKLFQG